MPRRCSYGDEQTASLRRIRKMHTDTFMQMKETDKFRGAKTHVRHACALCTLAPPAAARGRGSYPVGGAQAQGR